MIKFSSEITTGKNFFGWPLVGRLVLQPDALLDKVRSVGVWFTNYNNMTGVGLTTTPRVYLFPAGQDEMRSPNGGNLVRSWQVLDQILPVPFPVGSSNLSDPTYIPEVDSLAVKYCKPFASMRISARMTTATPIPANCLRQPPGGPFGVEYGMGADHPGGLPAQ